MYSTKIKGHEYAAVKVNHYNDGTIALQSYNTIVIEIDPEGWMTCTGTYSRTTIKHIGWFMRELGLTYYDAKAIAYTNEQMNIHTGEIRGC